MFERVTIHGAAGSILWGHRTAAVMRAWRIAKHEGRWVLTATLERNEPVYIRQSPLLFTAPRDGARDGFWAWPVVAGSLQVGAGQLRARLGPPEQ